MHRYLDLKKGISVKKVFVLRTLMPFTLAGDSSRSLQIELKRKLNRTLKLSDKKKFEYFQTNIRIYSVSSLAIMAIHILPALSPKLEMECSSLMRDRNKGGKIRRFFLEPLILINIPTTSTEDIFQSTMIWSSIDITILICSF